MNPSVRKSEPGGALRLRILHLEDDPKDAELVHRTLEADGLEISVERVWTRETFIAALQQGGLDLVISDFALPGFDGASALVIARRMAPLVPFIMVSGTLGEDEAVEIVRGGATDYILKQRLTRLGTSVRRALAEAAERARRRQAEESLANKEIELRQAQKMEAVGRLASGIAHEINTPVQYVGDNLMFLDQAFESILSLLRELEELPAQPDGVAGNPGLDALLSRLRERTDLGFLREEVPASIRAGLDGVARINHIVKAMKEFAHPGSRDRVPADLNRAIENAVTVARGEYKQWADVRLELDPALGEVPCLVGEFNQVMLNLIVNAAHAIRDVVEPRKGPRGVITISSRREQEMIEIRVTDTGAGIPEELRTRVFEPFFTTKEIGKGTGQGLAIAYDVVVNKHGGRIALESEVGRGTTFLIALPAGGLESAAGDDEQRSAA